eukprot:1053560-Rhodomonas_salina.1
MKGTPFVDWDLSGKHQEKKKKKKTQTGFLAERDWLLALGGWLTEAKEGAKSKARQQILRALCADHDEVAACVWFRWAGHGMDGCRQVGFALLESTSELGLRVRGPLSAFKPH